MAQVFHQKQETSIDFSEARLEAAVEKMCAGYQSIRNAKKQRSIVMLKANNPRSKTSCTNRGKTVLERIEWTLRQLKRNRRR
ncbi:hypothetical protein C5167_011993 [Papaver somniferum]|uniref:Uncharacterized protein n=1 Tax=Papaver somniferum TaxID=3469 RepID=A0A4Y7J066_PAPSO|nr:hypothetical protein C5167_011993 [Papaver somniferum]